MRECAQGGTCEAVKDYISRELFEEILDSEEDHIDFLETQLELMNKVGLQNGCRPGTALARPPWS